MTGSPFNYTLWGSLFAPAGTPAEFTRYVQAEASKYEQLVRDGKLKVDQ
jgi:tripartite-type tricarboxylate transporter receptor subunit TctC